MVELGPPQLGLQPYGMLQSWFHVIYNLRVWGIGSGRCQAKPNGREDAWVEFMFLGGFGQGFLEGIEEFVPFMVLTCKEVRCSFRLAFAGQT